MDQRVLKDTRLIKTTTYLFLAFSMPPTSYGSDQGDVLGSILGPDYAAIASGYPQQLSETPGVVTVITADDISRIGATNIDEVLATVPGIHVSTARGYRTIYAVRGIYSANNSDFLINIDGIPVRDPVLGGRPIVFTLPVQDISRIEVNRGATSVVHGSDAIGGVINIITKTGSELINNPVESSGGRFTGYIGNFGTYGGSLMHGGITDDFDYAISVQAETTKRNDRKIKRDAATLLDQQFMTQSSLAPGTINQDRTLVNFHYDLGYKDKYHFRLGVRATEDVGSGAGGSLALSPNDDTSNRWINMDFEYADQLNQDIGIQSSLAYRVSMHNAKVNLLPANNIFSPNALMSNTRYVDHQLQFKTLLTIESFQRHKIHTGVGFIVDYLNNIKNKQNFIIQDTPLGLVPVALEAPVELETLIDDPIQQKLERHQIYALIQDEWSLFEDTSLTLGFRVDSFINEQTFFSPRAVLVHHFSPFLTGKLLYNRAFHMSSFFEEANSSSIKQEIIDMLEVSFEAKDLQSNTLTASWYGYKLKDLIIENPNGLQFPAFRSINLRGTGAEFAATYHPSQQLTAKISYAFNWVVDQSSNLYGLTPNHMVYSELSWDFLPTWRMTGQAKWISKRRRVQGSDSRKPLNAYTNVTFNISKQLYDSDQTKVRLNFKINNLLDTDQREPSVSPLLPDDIPLPGRSFLGLLEVHY